MTQMSKDSIVDNRYVVQNELGKGGMGAVYRAQDRLHADAHDVALKRVFTSQHDLVFNSLLTLDASTMTLNMALAEEFRILASLRHPHIISVLDYGFDDKGQPYFTMDLMPNAQTIVEVSRGKTPSEQIKLVIQMLQALAYLHQRGIIHRDLKPNNVLVSDETVKVLDFGLAIQAQDTQDESIIGTFAYIAPEILQLQAATRATDLFSVGIILYEIILGKHPFYNKSLALTISNILSVPINTTPLRDLDIPDTQQLTHAVEKLLDKNPKTRYQQAYTVIEDLCLALAIPVPDEQEGIRESYLQAANFVGREAELDLLDNALSQAKRNSGSTWLIGGESGVGKSRLVEEMRIRALVRGVKVFRGQAISEGGAPYHLWKTILRRMLVAMNLDDEQLATLKHILPDLDTLLQRQISINENSDYREQLENIILSMLQKLPPSLIILEDMQWADSASIELLQHLSPKITSSAVLFVATYRSDERSQMPETIEQAKNILLKRLDNKGIRQLANAMLGEKNVSSALVDLLQRETEGNLFFLVEVVRALAEEAGNLRAISGYDLPKTVAAHGVSSVLERRLNRVPEWGQALIKQAAVAGRNLDMAVIETICGDIDLELWLMTCVNVALLDADEADYRFAHDKLREMLIARLSEADFKNTHREIAIAIERVHDVDEQAHILALHWQKAGNLQKEFEYSVKASQLLSDFAVHNEAAPLAERVLELYDSLKIDDEPLHAEALFTMAFIYHGTAQHEKAHDLYKQSLAVGEKLDNQSIMARALSQLSVIARLSGKLEDALTYSQRTIEAAKKSDNHGARATAYINIGIINATQGNLTEAKTYFLDAKNLSEAHHIDSSLSASLISIGILSGMMEEYDDAKAAFAEAMQVEEKLKNRSNIASCAISLGDVHLKLGEYKAAQTQYHYGMQNANETGVVPIVLNAMLGFAEWVLLRDTPDKYDWALQLMYMAKLHPQTDHDNLHKIDGLLERQADKLRAWDENHTLSDTFEKDYAELIDDCLRYISTD